MTTKEGVHDEETASTEEAEMAESAALTHSSTSEEALEGGELPSQLGNRRFVYAAYLGAAIGIAFLLSKAIDAAWYKLSTYKPAVGEPRDDLVMPAAAVIGALVAIYYYRNTKVRTLAEQVADELSKVTWPSRKEVLNSTTVVIVTTLGATTFFALMDRFWSFLTDRIYGM